MKDLDRWIFITLLVLIIIAGKQLLISYGISIPGLKNKTETTEKDSETFDYDNFDFPTKIDNPWLPLKPGMQLIHEGSSIEDGEQAAHRIEFTVTDLAKEIDGVATVVVWIVDYSEDVLVEKEVAFFAQDNDGNVWYLGEYPESYEDGELVEAPAWIAGIEDAKAGIAMQAEPHLNTPSYSQGWAPAVDWTDRAQVYATGQETCVPVGCYNDVLVLDEFNAKEPGFKQKYYAPSVGNVYVGFRGEEEQQETLELVGINRLSPEALADIRKQALELEKNAYENSKEVYGQTSPAEYSPLPEDLEE